MMSNNYSIGAATAILIVCGILMVAVSGYIELAFFNEIDSELAKISIVVVASIEGAKVSTIYFYEYSKRSTAVKKFSGTTSTVLWTLRLFMLIVSCYCCFAKIAQYMDNPNYEIVVAEQVKTINESYDKLYESEKKYLSDEVEKARQEVIAQTRIIKNGEWRGSRYEEMVKQHEEAKKERELRLSKILALKDSSVYATQQNLKDDIRSESKLVQGVYNVLQKAGVNVDANSFASKYIISCALLVTLVIELIIWAACSVLGSIRGDLD